MSARGRDRKLFAVVPSMLLIVSVLPAGVIGAETTVQNVGNTPSDGDTRFEEPTDGPPVVLKAQAIDRIKNFSAQSNQLEAAKDRARTRLNESLAYYQGPTRVGDQHAFIDDAVALRALTDFHGTDQKERLDQIIELVARADNRSARQVIRDAEDAFDATEERLGSGTYHSAKAHVENARRQLARAERIRDRAEDKSGMQSIRTTARAVRTYGVALNQAHTALRLIDREVGPKVTLTRRIDPAHNGSETVQYTLVGNVTDPTGLDAVSATATINDNRTVALPLRGGYTNATFAKTINLTERVNTIEIAVAGEDGQQSNHSKQRGKKKGRQKGKKQGEKKGKKRGNNGNGKGGESSGQNRASTVVLRLDGDGLPDTYETNVTGTDPLNPDSDAPSTDSNEDSNGTIDGHEDFDSDHLLTIRERELGTDPLDADTDDDDLPDGFEEFVIGTDPLDADTDNDGTIDGAEDLDSDGLSNAAEYDAETSPQYADIDADGLTDPQELANGTDPWSADTDDDGLNDDVEPTDPFHTDPLDNDTDSDGIEDGNETYTTTASNETLGAGVELTGQGNVAGGTDIRRTRRSRLKSGHVQNTSATPVVSFTSDRTFENATLRFAYDESAVPNGDEINVSVYRFDESLGTFVPIESTVDTEANVVTANTTHFSLYTVFYTPTWLEPFQRGPADAGSGSEPSATNETVLIETFDDSDLSDWETDVSGNANVKVKNEQLQLRVYKCSQAKATRSLGTLNGTIRVSFDWGTAADGWWETSDWSLRNADTGEKIPYTVLSGEDIQNPDSSGTSKTGSVAVRAEVSGDVPIEFEVSPSSYCNYPDHGDTYLTIDNLNVTLDRSRDSDGDGIPDYREEAGLLTSLGNRIETDPYRMDTDGDSLPDPTEFNYGDPVEVNGWWMGYHILSNPARKDTDSDGLDDYEEVRVWDTNPHISDTDNDNLNDQVDPDPVEENALPEVEYTTARSYLIYQDQFRVRASGTDGAEDIEDITVHKYIDPPNPLIGDQWQDATGTVISSSGEWYEIRFDYRDERRFTEARPDRLKIMVTDELGNDVTILHDRENGDGVVKAGLAAGATVAVPSSTVGSFGGPPGWAAVAGVTVGATVVGGAMELSADSVHGHHQSQKFEISVPSTEAVGSWETASGLEVALTTGTVYATEVSHGREYTRGFGWEYIAATTSLSQADIQHVIETGTVVEYGSNKYVIGDPLSDKDKAILTIIGGIAVAAESYESTTDTCGNEVHIPDESTNDHPYKDGSTKDDLMDALKNPADGNIWTDGHFLAYIHKASNGVWHIVRVSPDNPFVDLITSTSLTDPDWDDIEDVQDELEERDYNPSGCQQ
ncbi:hypothetical protein [Halorhabdus rudnickae]|uniref:hypothetical protein n=1 Tax=Halorhabdus rudnickae TaxID=1775544 RepID=UPI001083636D|nr:hypothetical protein [Halorhabdus rudnickae]